MHLDKKYGLSVQLSTSSPYMLGLGCADLERTPFGACDSSHSLDNGHPTLYNDGEVHDLDLESASLRIAVKRLPQFVSATKV